MVKYDIKAVQRRIYVRVLKVKCVELSLHKLSLYSRDLVYNWNRKEGYGGSLRSEGTTAVTNMNDQFAPRSILQS